MDVLRVAANETQDKVIACYDVVLAGDDALSAKRSIYVICTGRHKVGLDGLLDKNFARNESLYKIAINCFPISIAAQ
jgi:hypothetical protein